MAQIQVDRLPFRSNLPEGQKDKSGCDDHLISPVRDHYAGHRTFENPTFQIEAPFRSFHGIDTVF